MGCLWGEAISALKFIKFSWGSTTYKKAGLCIHEDLGGRVESILQLEVSPLCTLRQKGKKARLKTWEYKIVILSHSWKREDCFKGGSQWAFSFFWSSSWIPLSHRKEWKDPLEMSSLHLTEGNESWSPLMVPMWPRMQLSSLPLVSWTALHVFSFVLLCRIKLPWRFTVKILELVRLGCRKCLQHHGSSLDSRTLLLFVGIISLYLSSTFCPHSTVVETARVSRKTKKDLWSPFLPCSCHRWWCSMV